MISIKICACGTMLAAALLIVVAVGVWTMPARMQKEKDKKNSV
jgi:hypothetical protein